MAWREEVARQRRAAFAGQDYWGRPVPGFGDPQARVAVVGLAPAAHGGNRTGRVFTGDRSGDWLFAAMWRAGLANQPTSVAVDDGLELSGAYVLAAVRCAPPQNKPTPAERDECRPFFHRELALLAGAARGGRPRPVRLPGGGATSSAFGPGPSSGTASRRTSPDGPTVLCSYHPSQQNTFTGKLTEPMFDAVFDRAGLPVLAGASADAGAASRLRPVTVPARAPADRSRRATGAG